MNYHLSFKDCPIIIGNKSICELNNIINNLSISSVCILVDQTTREYCLERLLKHASLLSDSMIIEIPCGESSKSIKNFEYVAMKMVEYNIDRRGLIINLGGGAILDFGVFMASVYKRGINFINIPTTLMAQVDASIGEKSGLNIGSYKNQVGLFSKPTAIIIDPQFLITLTPEILYSGLAEVFKYALIDDKLLWSDIKKINFNHQYDFTSILLASVKTKLAIIENDIYDWSERRKLNFGHSIGHALESLFLSINKPISHGYAVAIGIICESYISFKEFNFSKSVLDDITYTILRYFPSIHISKKYDSKILSMLSRDKKNNMGYNNFTLIKDIGKSDFNFSVDHETVLESINYYRSNV